MCEALRQHSSFSWSYIWTRDLNTWRQGANAASAKERQLQVLSARSGLAAIAERCDLIVIGVRDEAIAEVAGQLATSAPLHREGPAPLVLHLAGRFGSEILAPCTKVGYRVAAFHPAAGFPEPRWSGDGLQGVFCALEAAPEDFRWLATSAKAAGAKCFPLEPEQRRGYHAAAATASNFSVTLIDFAISQLTDVGVEPLRARDLALDLARRALADLADRGPERALTGPIRRGDGAAISAHLESLGDEKSARELYFALARRTLDLARRADAKVDRSFIERLLLDDNSAEE